MAKNSYGIDRTVISLQVQEPPKFPVNLHVLDLGSRSVTLTWLPNDQGPAMSDSSNKSDQDPTPISNYILQYKKAEDVWHEHNNQHVIPGDRTTAHLNSLKPANAYHIRLYAENHLGTSAPSDILFLQTDSEMPSSPPQDVKVDSLDSQQLLITWRAPLRESWNGDLLGFIIAYQKHGASYLSSKNYTKISSLTTEGLNDFRLIGLEKYTHYAITVSAFNIKGEGPPSEVVLGHTLEDVPAAHPIAVTCLGLTAQNIEISWQSPPKVLCHGIVQGYKLLYEPVYLEHEYSSRETKITSALNTVLHGLQPFTNYSVQILAFTRAGDGPLSPAVTCITEEAVPDAPKRVKSVVSTASSVIVSWLPPSYPNGLITKYTIFIRILEKEQELQILKEVLSARTLYFEAKDLNLKKSYEAWVTASTKVGQGPSTPVIKLIPSSSIPAAII
ncbi:cell adhesion molecule Dscam2-like, partial [Drosophila tropicalis]|uniref:cell adhesion molecule Dscam2-like n=1 Tax=Drosophila tropicalis TaxID=46794 RepID=UPI0035ABC2AC